MKNLDKIKAVMLGHAVADALGVPVEFLARRTLDADPVESMRGYGTYPVPAGCWSDDTSMSLATLDSLKNGYLDYKDIMQNFVGWYANAEYTATDKVFDIGTTCFVAINNFMKNSDINPVQCGLADERSNGNGSLMRIHPMALYLYFRKYSLESALDIIHDTSCLTHAHERSEIGCGIYSLVLWELLKKPSKKSIVKGLERAVEIYKESDEFETYNEKLFSRIGRVDISGKDKLENEISRDEIKSSGYVVDTLEAAIWCVLTTDSYKECVLKAVNLGGDTDTVAAVAGGLAGAMYGLRDIPHEWLAALLKRDYIEELCESAYEKWRK